MNSKYHSNIICLLHIIILYLYKIIKNVSRYLVLDAYLITNNNHTYYIPLKTYIFLKLSEHNDLINYKYYLHSLNQ